MWASLPAYIQAARDVLGLDLPQFDPYQAWEDCAMEGGFRVMHEEFCLVSDFPLQIHKDDKNRPHNDAGPSHEWRDGWKLWHIHGVRVNEQIVMYPNTLTLEQIDAEMNAEVRRVMIERFGAERYLLESGAKPVQRDDYGVLYRRDVRDDEPIVMVRLLNSTPEPDGVLSQQEAEAIFGCDAVQRRLDTMRAIGHRVDNQPRFKAYMLRVPPDVKTAHEAVAWTFGKDSQSYAPSVES